MANCDCSWCDTRKYKEFVQGGAGDGYEDTKHKKSAKNKKRKKVPGCPGNDGKKHLYVWTTEGDHWLTDRLFYQIFGYHKYEFSVCCGCGKRRGSRRTERYMKKARSKWDSWENRDERYRAEKQRLYAKYGWRYFDWL